MTALSADKTRRYRGTPQGDEPMDVAASETIYAGALVARDSSGNAVAATDSSGEVVVGVAPERKDNSSGSAGDLTIVPQYGQREEFEIQGSTLDSTDIGTTVVVQDDQTVTNTATATNNVEVGVLRGITSDGLAEVEVGVFTNTAA